MRSLHHKWQQLTQEGNENCKQDRLCLFCFLLCLLLLLFLLFDPTCQPENEKMPKFWNGVCGVRREEMQKMASVSDVGDQGGSR